MRSKLQIEESAKDLIIPNQSGHIRLGLELLLDIRELLVNIEQLLVDDKDRQVLKQVTEARKRAEDERKAKVSNHYVEEVKDASQADEVKGR